MLDPNYRTARSLEPNPNQPRLCSKFFSSPMFSLLRKKPWVAR